MAKSKIFCAASIGLALAAGCSSSTPTPSSTSHDAGETSDATTTPPNPGVNQAEAATGLNPGMGSPGNCSMSQPCPSGMQCCLPSILAGSGTCMDPSQCTTGSIFQCMSAAGCMGSQVCCGQMSGNGFSLKCVSPGTCMGIQLCDTAHTCPTGQPCMAAPMMPGGMGAMAMFCNNGMFGNFGGDGGTSTSSDSGSSDASSTSDAQSTSSDAASEAASDAGGG